MTVVIPSADVTHRLNKMHSDVNEQDSYNNVNLMNLLPLTISNVSVSTNANRNSSDQAYLKALSRIASLEKNIEFINKQHSHALIGLYEEIERLQCLSSGNSR